LAETSPTLSCVPAGSYFFDTSQTRVIPPYHRLMTQIRCAIYARCSTVNKGQHTDNQLLELREFAIRQGWEIVIEYTENISGKRSDRAQLQAMFAAASRRKFDLLLFWSMDRLSREGVVATLQYLQRLSGYGVAFRSLQEQYLDSTGPMRDAVIGILAAVAAFEHQRISERVKAGQARAKAQGRTLGRPPAEENYKLIQQVATLRAEGASIRSIAITLKRSPTTIHKLVRLAA
jgi:DNA invertase Pin-like site-specific DNA recombinase